MPTLSFTLNGRLTTVEFEDGESLLDVLRERLHLTAAKEGCGQGTCGCCTVLVNGRAAAACLKKPERVEGASVVTLEGISPRQRELLAEAFVQEGAVQCGFCTPGIVVRATTLLGRGTATDRDKVAQALAGHVCRCTGWTRIVDAIETAGEAWQHGGELTPGPSRRHDWFGEALGRTRPSHEGGCDHYGHGVGGVAPRYGGRDLALGEKPFVADLKIDGMAHGAVVLAAHPRARVLAIETAAAAAMPGVIRILTAADVPGERTVGVIVRDWPVFIAPGEITRCVGDVLALVVADTRARARRAARAVAIYVEVLTPLTTPEAALAPGAPVLHDGGNILDVCDFARGDVDAALAVSAHTVRQRFQTQRIEHAFLEPEACLALPADGGVHVLSQGQGVHDDQRQIAAILGVARERVMVELVSSGGAFGGKEDMSVQGQTALAAFLLGRPVKTVLSREESILMHPKRHPLVLDYEAGCDTDGRLQAMRVRIVGDTGAYASVGAKVLERAAGHACGPYAIANVDVRATTVYTNNPPSGAMRGFGANQAAFAVEGVLDMLAEKVGIDRWEIRHRNVLRPGDRFAPGQIMTASCGVLETLEAVREVFYASPTAGIACGIKNTGIGNGMEDIGRVLIRVRPGGRLDVLTGYTEMGQGLFTILGQVIAEETALDPACMEVGTRSELAVECGMTTASRATALASEAARRAGRKLAAALAIRPLADLAGEEFHGEYICDFTVPPGTDVDNPITHVTFGYATQVVILDEAGQIARVVAAHDVGRAINPLHCVQQIEGAVHMGLGYALCEDLPCTDGRPDSLRFRDLGIIPAKATPPVDVILVEVPDEVGGYGSKGVGEIGLVPTAAAVASALYAFDGIRRTTLPMSDAPAARGLVPPRRRQN